MMSMAPLIADFAVEGDKELNELKAGTSFSDPGYTIVNIAQWPNGMSSQYEVEVADGHSVDSLSLSMEPMILPRQEELSWQNSQDFNDSRADFENIQYNGTGIKVLPLGISYDFENGTGSHWTLGSGWYVGQDTSLSTPRSTSGTNALYTYNGNYPNYLSSTSWATSPSINCAHCSGSWEMSFQRRLGIESYYYDHAYIQAKDANGNWNSVWSHSSTTVNEVSFSRVSYSISSYISNNPDFQIRFGIGTTDGSVTYTGWNIDDLQITPVSGVSNSAGWWKSPSLGHTTDSDIQVAPGPYGLMSLVGVYPTGSTISWSIFDATLNTVIPGFEARDDLVADIGTIDWVKHPSINFKIELSEGSGGSPWIKSINMMGRWRSELIQYPVDDGWYLENCSWVAVSGSGELRGNGVSKVVPPEFNLARPTSRIFTDITLSGNVEFGFYDIDEVWKALPDKGVTLLPAPMSHLQFEIRSTSGVWSIESFNIDLNGGGMPQDLSIDVGHDGAKEMEISDPSLGWLGHQQRFSNGANSHQMFLSNFVSQNLEVILPKTEVDSFSLELVPITSQVANLEAEVIVDGQTIAQRVLGDLEEPILLVLDENETHELSSLLVNSSSIWIDGILDCARVSLRFTSASGDLLVRGLSISQNLIFEVEFTSDSPLLMSLNDVASDMMGSASTLQIPLAMQMALPGAVRISLLNQENSHSSITTSLILLNGSETLSPSEHWIEVDARHQVFSGNMNGVQFDIISDSGRVSFLQKLDGSVIPLSGNSSLVNLSDEVSVATFQGNEVFTEHRFQIHRDWDDEAWADIRVRPVMDDGIRGLSAVENFGEGPLNGIENDIEIHDWWVENHAGQKVPFSMPYLRTGTWVEVGVEMRFEDSTWQTPRVDEVDVVLHMDGVVAARGTVDEQGIAKLPILVPSSSEPIVFTLNVSAGDSQEIIWRCANEHSFTTDSLAPVLLASSVAFEDHRPTSQAQLLEFTIGDVPVLPHYATMMLWRSWIDDVDSNGIPDDGEHFAVELEVPDNLSATQGIYRAYVNDLSAAQGAVVSGYILSSDPAGNELIGGGGPGWDNQLFMYQIRDNGAPFVHTTSAGHVSGPKAWLHPGELQHMQFPFDEPNGRSDVAGIRVELASTVPTSPMEIVWEGEQRTCTTSDQYLNIHSCGLKSRSGDEGPYATDLVFDIQFSIAWEMQPDRSTYREPTIEIWDRSFQNSFSVLPDLRWRFSSDLMIDSSSLEVSSGGVGAEVAGAWVKPGQVVQVEGLVKWADSGELVLQDIDVLGRFLGSNNRVLSQNGSFTLDVTMSSQTGEHPLVLSLDYLPALADDLTNPNEATIWFVVDATAPRISDVVAPREDAVLSLDDLDSIEIEFRIHEDIQMDGEQMMMQWRLREDESNSLPLAEGEVPAYLAQSRSSGTSIPATALLDLEGIVDLRQFEQQVILEVWIVGKDAAGNIFSEYLNSPQSPMATWNMEMVQPVFELNAEIGTSAVDGAEVGDELVVDVSIANVGRMDGEVRVRVEAVDIDGSTLIIHDSDVAVAFGQSELVRVDWLLKKRGEYTMVVYLDDVESGSSESVSVVEKSDESWFSSTLDNVNPVFLWILGMLLLSLIVVLAIYMRSGGDDSESLLSEEDHYLDGDHFQPEAYHQVQETQY